MLLCCTSRYLINRVFVVVWLLGVGTFSAASADAPVYDTTYYLKGALAGGICCSFTHGALCPVDVVKTRIQLEPEVYNKGMVAGFRQVIAAEGVGALATGLGPTVVGYFVQGQSKFRGNPSAENLLEGH